MNARRAREPNFIIVGAPKCGTTSMMHYLNAHPNVFFANPKEPYYFCDDFPYLRAIANMTSWARYERLFTGVRGERAVGEGSTMYMCSQVAIQNIMDRLPDIKIIAMTRNPVSLAVSFHSHMVKIDQETVLSLEDAWKLQQARREGRDIPRTCIAPEILDYLNVCRVGSQIEHLQRVVPPAQRLILPQEELVADSAAAYARVLDFLGVEHDGRTSFPRFNEAGGTRSQFLGTVARSRLGRLLSRKLKEWVPKQALQNVAMAKERLLITRAPAPTQVATPGNLSEVQAALADEVTILERALAHERTVQGASVLVQESADG